MLLIGSLGEPASNTSEERDMAKSTRRTTVKTRDERTCGDTIQERIRNLRTLKLMLGLDAEQLEQKAQALEYAMCGVSSQHRDCDITPIAAMARELRNVFAHAAGVSRIEGCSRVSKPWTVR
jgi:hypothetical protein